MRVHVYYSPIVFLFPVIGFFTILVMVFSGRAFESDLGQLQQKGYCSTESICKELGYLTEHGAITTKGWNATH